MTVISDTVIDLVIITIIITSRVGRTAPNKMSLETVWNGCVTNLSIRGLSADCSRLEVQLHWRRCCILSTVCTSSMTAWISCSVQRRYFTSCIRVCVCVCTTVTDSTREKIVKFLQSNPVQILLCVIVLLDAGVVIAQILLDLNSVKGNRMTFDF